MIYNFLYHKNEKILSKYEGMQIMSNSMLTLLPKYCGHKPQVSLKLCAQ